MLLGMDRESIDDSAYGPYWCLVNTSSNTAATISDTARIEQSHSPVAVPKGGAIVNGGRQEGIVNFKVYGKHFCLITLSIPVYTHLQLKWNW